MRCEVAALFAKLWTTILLIVMFIKDKTATTTCLVSYLSTIIFLPHAYTNSFT